MSKHWVILFICVFSLGVPTLCWANDEEHELMELIDQEYKDEVIKVCTKTLYQHDAKYYDHVLAKVADLLKPVVVRRIKTERDKNRFYCCLIVLDKLLHIHKEEIYCSIQKRTRLRELLQEAKVYKRKICNNESIEIPQHFENLWNDFCSGNPMQSENYQWEVLSFMDNLRKKNVKSVGGNVAAGVGVDLGLGVSVGSSRDIFGQRHLSFVGQGVMGGGIGARGSVGFYEFETDFLANPLSKELSRFFDAVVECSVSKGFMVGGTISNNRMKPLGGHFQVDHFILEAGINPGYQVCKIIGFNVIDLLRLPSDKRMFRSKLGLIWETGTLPDEITLKINSADSRKEIKRMEKEMLHKYVA